MGSGVTGIYRKYSRNGRLLDDLISAFPACKGS